MNHTEQFVKAIEAAGITPPESVVDDGKLHRFSSNGKPRDEAGWYILHSGNIPAGIFGDWRTGLSQTWRADIDRRLTPAEESSHRARIEEMRGKREAEETSRKANAASKTMAIWKASKPASASHPYLLRKKVSPTSTIREIDANTASTILGYSPKSNCELLVGRLLVAPVKVADAVSTCELIDNDGRKSALYGGEKSGGYWAAQPLPKNDGQGITLLIGEGVATVLSASQATGYLAIAALTCGNLEKVAVVMRKRYPSAKIVVLADIGNGQSKAKDAAQSAGCHLAIPNWEDRPDNATDFNDMAALVGLHAVRAAIENATAPVMEASLIVAGINAAGYSKSDVWAEPQPLAANIDPEPYPIDALPSSIRDSVEEVVSFVKAPLPLVASSALAALSLAIQSHADVKRSEKLSGPIGLFLLSIADSGERKSTCDGFFTKAIRDYEAAQVEVSKPIISDYLSALASWEAKHNGIKEKIRQLAKNNKPTAGMESALRELGHEKPEQPKIPRLIYADATPEALAFGLAKNWSSGGVISAEAGIVFGSHGMGKDSVMRNLALLNQLWDGTSLTIDRRSTESFTVRGARLTVALQVQGATLREFFFRSGALARGTGFLARFLLTHPESTQGYRPFTEAPEKWPSLATFNLRITEILNKPVMIDEDGGLTPLLLELTSDAKEAWIAFHDAIESELKSGGELYDVRDVASKSADNAVRLAALFHVFTHGLDGAVGLDAFEGASRIAAWHLHESRRYFGELGLPDDQVEVAKLDNWLIKYCTTNSTNEAQSSKILQYGPKELRKKSSLDAAMHKLNELNRARWINQNRGKVIQVNPLLLKGVKS